MSESYTPEKRINPEQETMNLFSCDYIEDLNLDVVMTIPAVVLNIFDKKFTIIAIAENDKTYLDCILAEEGLVSLLGQKSSQYRFDTNFTNIKNFLLQNRNKQEIINSRNN